MHSVLISQYIETLHYMLMEYLCFSDLPHLPTYNSSLSSKSLVILPRKAALDESGSKKRADLLMDFLVAQKLDHCRACVCRWESLQTSKQRHIYHPYMSPYSENKYVTLHLLFEHIA